MIRKLFPISMALLVISPSFAAASELDAYYWPLGANPCSTPRPVDVLFVFDTTGSMGGVLSSAKSGAASVMSAVRAAIPDSRFGVANYRDYVGYFSVPGYGATYGSAGDYPWKLNLPISASTAAAQTAINGLAIGNGADWPESFVRAAYETYSDAAVGWRPGAIRVVIVFADAPGHDTNFGGYNTGIDPGRNAVIGGGDDLDYETTITGAVAKGIKFGLIQAGAEARATAYFNYAAARTGGIRQSLSGSFVTQVTNMILSLVPNPQPALLSHAFPISIKTSVPSLGIRPVETWVGPATGVMTDGLLTVPLPFPINGYVKVAQAESVGTGAPGFAGATAYAYIEELSLLGGTVFARGLAARAAASISGSGSGSISFTGTQIAHLSVNSIPQTVTGSPTTIPIPLVGQLVVWEASGAAGYRNAWANVNLLHLTATVGPEQVEVIVGHAFASAGCQRATPDPTPGVPPPCIATPTGLRVCAPVTLRTDADLDEVAAAPTTVEAHAEEPIAPMPGGQL